MPRGNQFLPKSASNALVRRVFEELPKWQVFEAAMLVLMDEERDGLSQLAALEILTHAAGQATRLPRN